MGVRLSDGDPVPQGSAPKSQAGLRFRQKEARRADILDAAESLIRETGSTDFAMQILSDRAGLSRATPFNLFGSKSAILYSLLNRTLDAIFERSALTVSDPFDRVLRSADSSALLFVGDPIFYRPLYRFVLGVEDPVHRPAFMSRALEFWTDATQGVADAGLLPSVLPHRFFAMQLRTLFVGALDFWVMREVTDREFVNQVHFSTAQHLLSVAVDNHREYLLSKMRSMLSEAPAQFQ
ncbi:TetR/AcrR family transcriptional regulator [Sphingomonas bisphenolicum]